MKLSFILPTYNESDNISRILTQIHQIAKNNHILHEILVIDDLSSDGTIDEVRGCQLYIKKIKLYIRKEKRGVGNAHRYGYNHAHYENIILHEIIY